MGEQSVVIEYPWIILFTLIGGNIFNVYLWLSFNVSSNRITKLRFIFFWADKWLCFITGSCTAQLFKSTAGLSKETDFLREQSKICLCVYRWTNKEKAESYIGSSINLSRRLCQYFSLAFLNAHKKSSRINRALLKYGISNFMAGSASHWRYSNTVINLM